MGLCLLRHGGLLSGLIGIILDQTADTKGGLNGSI
ncbi:hypothetical protein Xekk_04352 [Xenorhabdus sp. KK7.4]|nr:hypothetical protein Xekk_04352 [Xenorhabdus sp. KK7.4]